MTSGRSLATCVGDFQYNAGCLDLVIPLTYEPTSSNSMPRFAKETAMLRL